MATVFGPRVLRNQEAQPIAGNGPGTRTLRNLAQTGAKPPSERAIGISLPAGLGNASPDCRDCAPWIGTKEQGTEPKKGTQSMSREEKADWGMSPTL